MLCNATLPTPFGLFTLSADDIGLRGLLFPAEQPPLPPGSLVALASQPLLAEAGQQLLAYLAGRLHRFDLPLSIHGTPFQQQVWAQLRAIPYGETLTYGELAACIGGRQKARAVGGAAHANPLAIIIPCHRLIGAGGKLTGFGGGLAMKQALLDLERQNRDQEKKEA
ncbi:methylated-DNA/protein-cysteinemethyltransferase [Desulfobulbus propionicus DSM 2032]|uniref:Methylated-DNA--protein-cysteine methyltransferase n=1 Tax=Desulfobulbus propionicus (strain ATCC 33891 / DSM 2032 / VKM B-1956 / 1pr3) TaxID=577650 RepID=A0A7U4DNI7_DESPD|nr:methylated-DNA--[protein]-cysteine S-methyltransferase [Desulfobulbus propionicus]ADW17077.1 methylated-DNA/protein-cysteinemethyltransferase [Desulfobulbus propionicus DSM 2032]